MNRRRAWFLVALSTTTSTLVGVACVLNPQPLPPGEDSFVGQDNDASSADAGGTLFGSDASAPPVDKDAGVNNHTDAGSDVDATSDADVDAGDADATDANDDADASD